MYGKAIGGKESDLFKGFSEGGGQSHILVSAPPVGLRKAKGFCMEERAGQDPVSSSQLIIVVCIS